MLQTTTAAQQLLERIHSRTAIVAVVGLGYVGLPLAVEKAKAGYTVIGLDRNPRRVTAVSRGESYIDDVSTLELEPLVTAGQLRAGQDFDVLVDADVIVICVPTPLTKNLTPDLQYVRHVTEEVAQRLRPGQLVSLESTTYPGTTAEVMLPILCRSGLLPDQDFFLAHSPERVDPGNKLFTTKNTTKVVGAIGETSLRVASAFYETTIDRVIAVSSSQAAELTKVFENTFRAVNIALVNELTMLCDRLGLSVWEVLDAAFTKPFGIMPFYPGPGVGGHCIPIDPHYLEWKAKEVNFHTHFISLAGEINRRMPEFVKDKAVRVLNDAGLAISGAHVLLVGLAYKKNVSDVRESPALEVMQLLHQAGAEIAYHDPFVPECVTPIGLRKSVPLTDSVLARQDLVVITTNHDEVDYRRVVELSQRILDTRNATRDVPERDGKVWLL
ncbi:MAG: nucleotide sugar dehydrogenase [Alicyclobacillus herbarius]|uniref:nucleotide sugar dehydrogenase n=1 Tax=Alicyclobacillus herbarius TaxID=122960 RepID=UPI002353B629|nr:nucleotide sugar dehydrogenase [Alicyclobacillus herbarius]MCL6631848.1 nucleotide sugar dehydrogenase [Alicyclobacillus herbarius]